MFAVVLCLNSSVCHCWRACWLIRRWT